MNALLHIQQALYETFGAQAVGPALIVHRGAEPWIPTNEDWTKIRNRFQDPNAQVHLYPRKDANQVLGQRKAPYAFRAFTRNGVSHIFVDRTETPESIAWLIAHELGHVEIGKDRLIEARFKSLRPRGLDRAGDRFHEVDPEERHCDKGADSLFPGRGTNRAWWRRRVDSRHLR